MQFPLFTNAASAITISEGTPGTPVWSSGAYVPGVAGVTGATAGANTVNIAIGSGTYTFLGIA